MGFVRFQIFLRKSCIFISSTVFLVIFGAIVRDQGLSVSARERVSVLRESACEGKGACGEAILCNRGASNEMLRNCYGRALADMQNWVAQDGACD